MACRSIAGRLESAQVAMHVPHSAGSAQVLAPEQVSQVLQGSQAGHDASACTLRLRNNPPVTSRCACANQRRCLSSRGRAPDPGTVSGVTHADDCILTAGAAVQYLCQGPLPGHVRSSGCGRRERHRPGANAVMTVVSIVRASVDL